MTKNKKKKRVITHEDRVRWGRRGGLTTKRLHPDHLKTIAPKGAFAFVFKHGPDAYKKMSPKGVKARLKKIKERSNSDSLAGIDKS